MHWKSLTTESELSEIIEKSKSTPQVIYKHSTTCGTSFLVKERLEENETPETADFYLLDLLRYRSISNLVASQFKIHHESPQVLVIKDGVCVYNKSHSGIRMDAILSNLEPA